MWRRLALGLGGREGHPIFLSDVEARYDKIGGFVRRVMSDE